MSEIDAFVDRMADKTPALLVKFAPPSNETPMRLKVRHRLGGTPDKDAAKALRALGSNRGLKELKAFYQQHNGVDICRLLDACRGNDDPLIKFLPAAEIASFTDSFVSGDRASTIDFNKSKTLYRGKDRWIAFARLAEGYACLTLFLDGEHAGKIFLATPQPEFNICRPVAKSFNALLGRFSEDLAAFLRLLRVRPCLVDDLGRRYGFVAMQYLPTGRGGPPSTAPKYKGLARQRKS